MKSFDKIKGEIDNFKKNAEIAKISRETSGAVTYISGAISALSWVIE